MSCKLRLSSCLNLLAMNLRLYLRAALAALMSVLICNCLWLSSQKSTAENKFSSNRIWQMEALPPVENAKGPESYAFDPYGGGPYTGLSNGRIVKWVEEERRWVDFAITTKNREGCEGARDHEKMEHICGRPMDLYFSELSGDLYIADAYLGILKVGPEGGVATVVATQAKGISFKFANSLEVDPDSGVLYFIHSSSQFDRRNYFAAVLNADKTGRLLKYDPKGKEVIELLINISLPCGMSLSKDGNYLLVSETTKARILKYWIKTEKAGTIEVFAQLPGFPDNINRSPRGGYWVALYCKKGKITELIQNTSWISKFLINSRINLLTIYELFAMFNGRVGTGVRLSENGDIVETFYDKNVGFLSEIMERDGYLWVGSVNLPFAGRYKL